MPEMGLPVMLRTLSMPAAQANPMVGRALQVASEPLKEQHWIDGTSFYATGCTAHTQELLRAQQ